LSGRTPTSVGSTSASTIDGAVIGLTIPFEISVGRDPFLIYRRGIDDGFHRRSNPANNLVPDLLLVVELGDRGPEPQHINDVKPAVGLNKCRRAITAVLVQEPKSAHS